MALKLDKAKKAYQESKRGGEFWTPDEGETRVYLHPPCREDDNYEPTDGLNYVPVAMHYSLGEDKKGACVCLDGERNKILNHPFVIEEFRKAKGTRLDTSSSCPVCQAIYEGRFSEDQVKSSRYQLRYLWGVTPWDFARRIGGSAVTMSPAPSPYMTGPTVYDGFMKAIVEAGDITDLDNAVLVKIVKTGQGLATKYQVSTDIETVKAPLRMDKGFKRAVLDAIKPGGDCDLFKIVASQIKTHGEITALISGVRVAEDEEAETPEAPAHPPCFGRDFSEDEECLACGLVTECAAKVAEKEAPKTKTPTPTKTTRPLPPVEPAARPAVTKAAPKPAPRPAPTPEPEPEVEPEVSEEPVEEPLPDDEAMDALEETPSEEAPVEESVPEETGDSEEDLDKLEEQLEKMSSKGKSKTPAKVPPIVKPPVSTKAPVPMTRTKTPIKR